jgi:radical SAM superfamily enzyme YgiQ (UPF0313 family)
MKTNSEIFRVLFLFPNEPRVGVVPSNLAILSACLKKAGHDVKLFDCSMYQSINYTEKQDDIREKLGHVKKTSIDECAPLITSNVYDDFVALVNSYDPDILAISLVDSTIQLAYTFIDKIKDKNIPVVVGGVGALFSYEKILKSGYVDFVCLGEGEEALPELCNKIKNKDDIKTVKNICYIDNGNIFKNSSRKLANLDELPPPDFSIYDDRRFYRPFNGGIFRMAQFDIDRGCPFSCSYCASEGLKYFFKIENSGQYYRTKSLDKFFKDSKEIIEKHSINFLYISSETLLALPIDKFRVFAERYKKEINLPFWCQTRLDSFTEEKTKILKDIGCQSISVGLEHGDEEFRTKILNKKLTNKSVLKGFKLLAKYSIKPTINSMIGLPDETRDLIFETIKMNRKISKILKGNHSINIFTFIPFSGTRLRQLAIDRGYVSSDAEIKFSWYKESMLTMPNLSKEDISGLEKTAHLYIKLDKKYWKDIEIAEKNDKKGLEMFDKLNRMLED